MKPTRSLLLVASAALTLTLCVVSYWIGYERGSRSSRAASVATKEDAGPTEAGSEARTGASGSGSEDGTSATEREAVADLKALRTRVESMGLEEVEDLRERIREWPSEREREALLGQFFRRWGELDGERAFMATLDGGSEAGLANVGRVAAGWAKVEPEAAWQALMMASNKGAIWPVSLHETVVEIAGKDVGKAMELLGGVHVYRRRSELERVLMQVSDPAELAAHASDSFSLSGSEAHTDFAATLFERWAELDFDGSLQAALGLEDRAQAARAMNGVLSEWAGRDGREAFAYVAGRMDDPVVGGAIEAVTQSWLNSVSAIEAGEVFEALGGLPEVDRYLSQLTPRLVSIDPDSTLQLISSVENQQQRGMLLSMATSMWSHNDLEAAEGYVFGLESEQDQAHAMMSTMSRRVQTGGDLEAYAQMVASFEEPGPRRMALSALDSMMRGPFRSLPDTRRQEVQAILDRFPEEMAGVEKARKRFESGQTGEDG